MIVSVLSKKILSNRKLGWCGKMLHRKPTKLKSKLQHNWSHAKKKVHTVTIHEELSKLTFLLVYWNVFVFFLNKQINWNDEISVRAQGSQNALLSSRFFYIWTFECFLSFCCHKKGGKLIYFIKRAPAHIWLIDLSHSFVKLNYSQWGCYKCDSLSQVRSTRDLVQSCLCAAYKLSLVV